MVAQSYLALVARGGGQLGMVNLRRMRGRLVGVLFLALGLFVGCGGEEQPGPGGTGGTGMTATGGAATGGATSTGGLTSTGGTAGELHPVLQTVDPTTPYGACVTYVVAQCQRRAECEGWTLGDDIPCRHAIDSCPDFFFSEGSNVTVDNLLECANDWENHSCDDWDEAIWPECTRLPGTVPDQEPCLFSSQCESRHCQGGDGQCGVCLPEGEEGDVCSGEGAVGCPQGTWCDGGTGTCEAPDPPEGECSSTNGCPGDQFCSLVDGATQCLDPAGPDEDCSAYGQCTEGYYCEPESVLCTALVALGQPCENGACQNGLYCDSGTCRELGALGDVCGTADSALCAYSLACLCVDADCTERGCYEWRTQGQPCGDGTGACANGLICEGGVCVSSGLRGLFDEACMQ